MNYILTAVGSAVVTAVAVYLLRNKIEAQIIRTVDLISGIFKKS